MNKYIDINLSNWINKQNYKLFTKKYNYVIKCFFVNKYFV